MPALHLRNITRQFFHPELLAVERDKCFGKRSPCVAHIDRMLRPAFHTEIIQERQNAIIAAIHRHTIRSRILDFIGRTGKCRGLGNVVRELRHGASYWNHRGKITVSFFLSSTEKNDGLLKSAISSCEIQSI